MKIIVYTCITGGHDWIKTFQREMNVDYVCFTDSELGEHPLWNLEKAPTEFADPRRNARKSKILSHRYFPGHDYSIWIDGALSPKVNFKELIESLGDFDIAVLKHPDRECLYREAHVCISSQLDNQNIILDQIDRYSQEDCPEKLPMAETRVVIRRHTPKICKFNELWWNEIKKGSKRDQISFPYCCWKLGINWKELSRKDFNYSKHKK